jgi:cysteine desulfurase
VPEPVEAYLDHAATSPLRPEVSAAIDAVRAEGLGNPSGAHRRARLARRRLDDAREDIADVLGRSPGDVVLTSGGTEADNLAVLGITGASAVPDATAACGAAEHHAVLDAVAACGGVVVAADDAGRIDLGALGHALADAGGRVVVVSAMLANNETGVVTDLAAVAAAVEGRALLHTDAVAAARWLPIDEAAAPADLVSVSAHKLGGPVGVGALAAPAGVALAPRQLGGGQERGRRSGTVDVAGAVGLATALRLAADERVEVVARVGDRRDRLAAGLAAAVPGLVVTAAGAERTAGTCHVCIPGVDAEALLFLLDEAGVLASAASSCSSGAQQRSHVLAAMGVGEALARGSLRLSLGPATTDAEIDAALAAVPAAVERLRDAADRGAA